MARTIGQMMDGFAKCKTEDEKKAFMDNLNEQEKEILKQFFEQLKAWTQVLKCTGIFIKDMETTNK